MKRVIIPYNSKLKLLARKLRNESTIGEILLWKELRNKKFYSFDFHRQKPLLNYIVDFYCYELNLVIEIDGSYHDNEEQHASDVSRDLELAKYNLTVLRFTEMEIRQDILNVFRTIEMHIEAQGFNIDK
ncbi:endonuclease domain-containing protein [Mucilaginibacter terrenus]|uniref:Endonuclease domain-containing protein n=1 Tax=Mucilaginibacter terrenus TaxID=2482727 RepID=A0A3E2NXY7_9SPHI|nr:endonuclease domain-containing protein [Mucilaginibacter terrenus]RFZ85888.1 endonuclease domain-containing protein [Mucilaginibacter terrenus]